MMMRFSRAFTVAALLAGLTGGAAQATVILNLTGKVTGVNSSLTSGFSNNQSITGTISYEETAMANSSTANSAYYYNTFSGSMNIGGKTYAFVPTDVLFVANNSSNQDQVSLYSSTSSGPSVGGYAPGYMTINFYDLTQATLSSTAVPTVAQLQHFPTKNFTLYFGSDYSRSVSGTISSITAVPEPAGWITMTLGFGMLGLAVRGRARTIVSPA